MRHGTDTSRAVHGDAHVPARRSSGLAAVNPDPNAYPSALWPGVIRESQLDRDRRPQRVTGATESDEKRVALGVDLFAVVGSERLAE